MKKHYQISIGKLFAISGILVSISSILTSILLYREVESFSIFTRYISDLGDGPNNSDLVFNFGAIITGILFILFFIFLRNTAIIFEDFKNWINLIFVLGLIMSLGYILVGIFTKEKARFLHNIGSVFYFMGLSVLTFSIGLWEVQKDYPNGLFALISWSIPLFPALYGIFFLIKLSISEFESITIFIEWLGYFAFKGWFFIFIGYFYSQK